jgi:hypothetical protein
MDIQPFHTKIDKSIQTMVGYIILENPTGFPRAESNLYCVSQNGKVVWTVEKPDPYTLYSRVRLNEDAATLSTYTIGGHACDLDLATGSILSKTSIQ